MRLRLPLARLVAVALFALLCGIVAAWALVLLAPRAPIAPAGAVAQAQPPADLTLAGQLFGGAPVAAGTAAAAAPVSNIQVAGVLAAGARGVALLAIDGKPARPFAVGEPVGDGLAVRSVDAHEVVLERGGQPMRLPAPPRASTAVLTAGAQRDASGASAAPPPPLRPLPPAGAAAQPAPLPGAGGPSPSSTPFAGARMSAPPPVTGPAGVIAPATGTVAPTLNAPSQ